MKYRSFLLLLALVASTFATAAPAGAAVQVNRDNLELTCFPHGLTDTLRYDNTWGDARSGGRSHEGTDLLDDKGTPVVAVAAGTVDLMRNSGRAGYYVRLLHDGGAWESWYMHLNNDTPGTDDGKGGDALAFAPGLAIGDDVKAGQLIGYVGDSGNAEPSSPHTHFEIHINGDRVNPYKYIVAVQERIDATYAMIDAIQARSTLDPDWNEADRLWDWLVVSGASQCLTDGYKDFVKHLLGELPGERVLLAGVIAR